METPLVRNGDPAALIVVGDKATAKEQLAARELQTYIEKLASARLGIARPAEALAANQPLLLVSRTDSNELIGKMETSCEVSALRPDGFILCSGAVAGRPALAIIGSNEMSVLYGAYALLEELGITFLLSGDLLPERVADLAIPEMHRSVEPTMARRGFIIPLQNPHSGIQSLSDYCALVDQMIKLRLNYVSFWVAPAEPWVEYTFRGEQNLIGDINSWESGYLRPRRDMITGEGCRTSHVEFGREHFAGRPYLAPMELQGVSSAAEAHRRFSGMMRALFRYARASGVQVGLTLNPVYMPYNLARFVQRADRVPASRAIFGAVTDPLDPTVLEHVEQWLAAVFETYPDIDELFVFNGEGYRCHPDDPELYERLWPHFREAKEVFEEKWLPTSQYVRGRTAEQLIETDMAQLQQTQQVVEIAKRLRPDLTVGMAFLFRGYLLPAVDKLIDREIPMMDFQSSGVIPLKEDVNAAYFAGMGERPRYVIPRVDDDGQMMGLPFYLRQYQRDGLFREAQAAGVTGFVGQLFRIRGTEHHTRFLAQGAWESGLTPQAFYERYAREVFGEVAAKPMRTAFRELEECEALLGWRGLKNFHFSRGNPVLSALGRQLLQQENPFDGPPDAEAMLRTATIVRVSDSPGEQTPTDKIAAFLRAIRHLSRALAEMETAQATVSGKGKPLLRYLLSKTCAYRAHLEMVVQVCRGFAAYASAFIDHRGDEPALAAALDDAERILLAAQEKAREAAQRFAEIVDHPCDLAILFLVNTYDVRQLRQVVNLVRRVVSYHHGRPYWEGIS